MTKKDLPIEAQKFIQGISSRPRFLYWSLVKLPSLFFWRVKLDHLDEEICTVSITFRRSTQNPFRSIYFAAQAGAGELSTGLLVQTHIMGKGRWSMLVVKTEIEFFKKATGRIVFSCNEGTLVTESIARSLESREPQQFIMTSIGKNDEGTLVTKMKLTWSVKRKE